jgi:hypothetical protein
MAEQIEKIVVKAKDELIDIVRQISKTEAKKILVSFVEDSDILISSINLKVLLDSADEKDALLALQIPNNSTGVRNAKLAGISVVDTPGMPSEDVWESAQMEYRKRQDEITKMKKKLPQDYKSENITSFEERIDSVLSKSQREREQSSQKEFVNEEIVVDQDIKTKQEETPRVDKEDLTKVDFKDVPDPTKPKKPTKSFITNLKTFFSSFKKEKRPSKPSSSTQKEQDVKRKDSQTKEKLLRLLPKLLIPLVVVLLLFAFLYYKFAPYVKATIYIESKPVEVEKVFTGNENIDEIDFENSEIPIKTETVTKSVSDTVTATGTAYRGEKAKGNVTISYINSSGCTDADEPINLSVGHQITSEDKNFVLTGDLTVTCNNYSVVGVEAVEVGEEYNIPSGKYFSVSDYSTDRVFGVNSSAFTGGSKEEYTVLSQQDVNQKVDELTEIAKEEAESSLADIGSGWEIIEKTIDSKVKEGSISTAVAIGTETNSSDISLEVESSATYYYTAGVDTGLNALLTEAAVNQNLFENGDGLNLTLTGDIEKDLTVDEKDGDVKITLTASSSVEPSIDREKIINDLRGMRWQEGVDYLNSLTFTADRSPVIRFNPEKFPPKLKHFPSRQGRIDIVVEKVTGDSE